MRKRVSPKNGEGTIKFVPFDTMFKLDERLGKSGGIDKKPRRVTCMNCGYAVSLKFYFITMEEDKECPGCKVNSEDYWKDKLHRKVANAG